MDQGNRGTNIHTKPRLPKCTDLGQIPIPIWRVSWLLEAYRLRSQFKPYVSKSLPDFWVQVSSRDLGFIGIRSFYFHPTNEHHIFGMDGWAPSIWNDPWLSLWGALKKKSQHSATQSTVLWLKTVWLCQLSRRSLSIHPAAQKYIEYAGEHIYLYYIYIIHNFWYPSTF